MGGLTKQYVITRMFMWILTIWIGATAIFFIPRLAPGDPVTAMVMRMAEREGRVENAQELIAAWKERFGLDEPLHVQYVRYLGRLIRFDFGYSLVSVPNHCLGAGQTGAALVTRSHAGGDRSFFWHRDHRRRAHGVAQNPPLVTKHPAVQLNLCLDPLFHVRDPPGLCRRL